MASPPDNSSILSGALSTSPKTIRGNSDHSHSPVRHRTSVGGEEDLIPRPRLSPTLARSYNPNDPDVRERQRAMDVDMAIHLSRARSNTVVGGTPEVTSPSPPRPPIRLDDEHFGGLSMQEEQDLNIAKGVGLQGDIDEQPEHFHPGPASEMHLNHLSSGHEPTLLVSLSGQEQDDTGGLPMYQPHIPVEQSTFDFSALECFGREEKTRLGIQSPTSPTPPDGGFGLSSSQTTSSTVAPLPEPSHGNFTLPLPRARQRKLSQSAPGPRRGKIALFEHSNGGPPPTLAFRSQLGSNGHALSAVPSYDNLPATNPVNGAPVLGRQSTASGHDRPYRFSFYSNALSATIHARSLSELPAEGQSFEQLFQGVNDSNDRPEGVNLSRPGTSMGMGPRSNLTSPLVIPERFGSRTYDKRAAAGSSSAKSPGASADTNTWWLDVQCPSDDEMKVLSKVSIYK